LTGEERMAIESLATEVTRMEHGFSSPSGLAYM